MSYDSIDSSVNPDPIELYEFVGTDQTYLMTSDARNVTIPGDVPKTYISTVITRESSKLGSHESDNLILNIKMPVNHPMVVDYAFDIGPPSLNMTLYRTHRQNLTEQKILWTGKVVSFSISGREATLMVPMIMAYMLEGLLPAPRYQGPCNHVLFDQFCRVDRSLHEQFSTISHINGNLITVAGSTFPNDSCSGGEMVLTGRSQRRMIIGNTGNVFRLSYPFMTPAVGNPVSFTRGCNHSFAACKTFLNQRNFGGFNLVPNRNPFGGRI